MKILIISVLVFSLSQTSFAVKKRDVCEWIVNSPLFDSLNAKIIKSGVVSFAEGDKLVIASANGTVTVDGMACHQASDRNLPKLMAEWIHQIPQLFKNLRPADQDMFDLNYEVRRKAFTEKLRTMQKDISAHLDRCEGSPSEAVAAAARDVKKTLDAVVTQAIENH